MAERAEQQSTISLPWWVRTCHVGWKAIRYFWLTFFLTLILPKAVDVLFSDKPLQSLPTLWPILEAIVHHPIWTLLIFLGLLLLTGLFWFGSRARATRQGTLSEYDRVYMLRRLRLRYEQMLAQSLQGAVQVELRLASRPAAVQNAVSLSLRLPDQPQQPLPPQTSVAQAYELAQQELLILGEPGAGKSTLLLELAHHLAKQAIQDATQPVPILIPLSSWATKRRPLEQWLAEQFVLLYDAPRNLSEQWLGKQLLPLLDGLDEMEASARPDCIAAINTYHRKYLQSLVVCSRTGEYEAAATRERLALHSAIVVQPLSEEQVDNHLRTLGKPLAALYAALRKNPVLREVATTPLMLQVLILAYHGTSVRELSHRDAELREQVWDDYVQRMVNRKGNVKRYPFHTTVARLSWLAKLMRKYNQTFIYRLERDWLLERPGTFTFYTWSIFLFIGLLVGLVSGLVGWLLAGLVGGVVFGLVSGLLGGLRAILNSRYAWSFRGSELMPLLIGLPIVGLVGGLVSGLLIGLVGGLVSGLVGGLVGGLISGLLVGFSVYERSATEEEMFIFSYGCVSMLLRMLLGLPFGLVSGLVGGVVGRLVGGPVGGLTGGLAGGLASGLVGWLDAAVQYYVLRFCLSYTRLFPWRAVSFLNDATARILLRRVDEKYSFIHRLLLEYFADLDI